MTKIPTAFADLIEWMKPLCRFKKFEDFVVADYKENRLNLKIYTKNHQYSISARVPGKEDNGYLGCVAQTRKPRAGEDWNRGNDLADGKYSEETFRKIVNDIVVYELVKVAKKERVESVKELED